MHAYYLGPYYSCKSASSLLGRLVVLVNAVLEADPSKAAAKRGVGNIEEWADGLFKPLKEGLLAAIGSRSNLTFDAVHWISEVTKILLAVSTAEVCPDDSREKLRKHAVWLVSALSWIPDDQDAIIF